MRDLACALVLIGALQTTPLENPVPLVLTHATVIDATGGQPKPDMTVVVQDGRIAGITPAAGAVVPARAQVVDATGKFLIPGLWDMHVHLGTTDRFLPFHLANGVTGIRSTADSASAIRRFREQIAAGTLKGPRIVATAGHLIDGPNPIWPESIIATSGMDAAEAVKRAVDDGAEFLKLNEMLTRDGYLGIAAEARKRGMSFIGHVPRAVNAGNASDAGLASIEHLFGIPLACSGRESELRARLLEATASIDANDPWPRLLAYRRIDWEALGGLDRTKCDELFRRFVKNGTRVVPTLVVVRATTAFDRTDLARDARMNAIPEGLKRFWESTVTWTLTPEERAEREQVFARYLELVGAMHRAGVDVLAGTDTPNAFAFPGFGVHDELALLTKAGLTPMEALQTATRNAAKFLKMDRDYGTIEKGKVADLLLLNRNPLEHIANTAEIAGVAFGGKWLPKDELLGLLERAKSVSP